MKSFRRWGRGTREGKSECDQNTVDESMKLSKKELTKLYKEKYMVYQNNSWGSFWSNEDVKCDEYTNNNWVIQFGWSECVSFMYFRRKEREKETGRSKRFSLNELSVATVSQQPGCILFKSGRLSEGYLWVFWVMLIFVLDCHLGPVKTVLLKQSAVSPASNLSMMETETEGYRMSAT